MLEVVTLDLQVPWPLSVVVNAEAQQQYAAAFRHLFALKCAERRLCTAWRALQLLRVLHWWVCSTLSGCCHVSHTRHARARHAYVHRSLGENSTMRRAAVVLCGIVEFKNALMLTLWSEVHPKLCKCTRGNSTEQTAGGALDQT